MLCLMHICLAALLLVACWTRVRGFIRLPPGNSLRLWQPRRALLALHAAPSSAQPSPDANNEDVDDNGSQSEEIPAELYGPTAPGILYVTSGDGDVDSDGSSLFPALGKRSAENALAMVDVAGRDKGPRRIIEIGLLPFEGPLFPKAREFLFIFEMRYRLLLNHVQEREHGHRYLGRCYYNAETDEIGSVGSLCRVVESRKLMDGKGE